MEINLQTNQLLSSPDPMVMWSRGCHGRDRMV